MTERVSLLSRGKVENEYGADSCQKHIWDFHRPTGATRQETGYAKPPEDNDLELPVSAGRTKPLRAVGMQVCRSTVRTLNCGNSKTSQLSECNPRRTRQEKNPTRRFWEDFHRASGYFTPWASDDRDHLSVSYMNSNAIKRYNDLEIQSWLSPWKERQKFAHFAVGSLRQLNEPGPFLCCELHWFWVTKSNSRQSCC